jgi:toxin-antitoxin system PIN domain toxin
VDLPDINVWFALVIQPHQFHVSVRTWSDTLKAPNSILFCRAAQQGLLRLLTLESTLRPYGIPPFTNAGAWQLFDSFLADPRISFASEPRNLESHWKTFTTRNTASPKLWMDAYLAAFALAGGHRLITTDHAFSQFKNLNLLLL